LFGTLVKPTSPEMQIIKKWRLSLDKHDGLQRIVCGTRFDGDYKRYCDLIIKEIGIFNNVENRKRLEEIFNLEFEKVGTFPETKNILERLKLMGYKIGLISNAYPRTRQEVLEKNDLVKYFDVIFLSYEIGMTKQNPRYYKKMLKKMGIPPEKSIMIGDSLNSDIKMSKKATCGKIGGILISQEQEDITGLDKLILVSNLSYVPESIEKYFSIPIKK
jgi:HAD superfamily hydrolase (TIGR01549 family)